MNNNESFLNYPEAALLLRISPQTLRKKVCRREIPYFKPFGPRGRVLFSETDLMAFIKSTRVEPDLVGAKQATA